ncbi:TPA: hypothetical protein ACOF2E_002909, partial [Staphylococcus aureus]
GNKGKVNRHFPSIFEFNLNVNVMCVRYAHHIHSLFRLLVWPVRAYQKALINSLIYERLCTNIHVYYFSMHVRASLSALKVEKNAQPIIVERYK